MGGHIAQNEWRAALDLVTTDGPWQAGEVAPAGNQNLRFGGIHSEKLGNPGPRANLKTIRGTDQGGFPGLQADGSVETH